MRRVRGGISRTRRPLADAREPCRIGVVDCASLDVSCRDHGADAPDEIDSKRPSSRRVALECFYRLPNCLAGISRSYVRHLMMLLKADVEPRWFERSDGRDLHSRFRRTRRAVDVAAARIRSEAADPNRLTAREDSGDQARLRTWPSSGRRVLAARSGCRSRIRQRGNVNRSMSGYCPSGATCQH